MRRVVNAVDFFVAFSDAMHSPFRQASDYATASAPAQTRQTLPTVHPILPMVGCAARTVRAVLKSIGLAMGVATVALSALGVFDARDGIMLLGIGLACVGLVVLSGADE